MSNSFIPRAYQAQPTSPEETEHEVISQSKSDSIGLFLMKVCQYAVVAAAFLVPLVFVPGLSATLGFTKALVALILGLAAAIFASLAALRFKTATTVVPIPLLLFWGVVIVAFLSAFLSGDVMDAVRGSVFEPQTAGFMAIAALLMTIPLVLQQSKIMMLYSLTAFAGSLGLVLLYSIIRFFFGPILPLGSFTQITLTPAGGLNDLAVFSAVAVVVGLITLLQLPLKNWMKGAVLGLIFAALITLMVANFFLLWIIVGFFGLLFLIYVLSRDTLFGKDSETVANNTPLLVIASLVVCVVSVLFVVAGDFAGARMNALTNVNYIEVRPSIGATLDMIKASYSDDILLGSGPNRFADVWRSNKDLTINETTFWNVDFQAGFGLIPTMFVTLGLLGGLLIVAFHLSYLYLGYRALLRSDVQDSFWLYAGTASFAAAGIFWLISYLYVPGAAVLLMTALFTGLSFVAYSALVPSANKKIPLASNQRRGFLMMTIAIIFVVAAVSTVFSIGKQYAAQAAFANAATNATSVEEFEVGVQRSYQLYTDDRFLNALNQLRINELQGLLNIAEPSEEDQNRFALLVQQSIALAQEAALRDNSNPQAYIALAEVYNILARAGVEGARDRSLENITAAEERDPKSPTYPYSRAFIDASEGNYDAARESIRISLSRKSNFTPALFLLSQIAVEEGNVEEAIVATRQVVTYESNNPTRYYQLGILLAANNQLDEAIAAYQTALQLNPEYANARYMLGLAYVAQGNSQAALNEFRTVQQNNSENEALRNIINELESTGTIQNLNLGLEPPVQEANTVVSTEDGVVASSTPETDLISTVNTEPAPAAESEDTQNQENTESAAQ